MTSTFKPQAETGVLVALEFNEPTLDDKNPFELERELLSKEEFNEDVALVLELEDGKSLLADKSRDIDDGDDEPDDVASSRLLLTKIS